MNEKWFYVNIRDKTGYITSGIGAKACFEEEVEWKIDYKISSVDELNNYVKSQIEKLKGYFVYTEKPNIVMQNDKIRFSAFFRLLK